MHCSSSALDSYTKTNAFWSFLRSFSRPWASSARVLSSLPSMWNARARSTWIQASSSRSCGMAFRYSSSASGPRPSLMALEALTGPRAFLAQPFPALGQLRAGTVLVAEHVERPRSLHVDPGLVVALLRNGLPVQLQRVGHAALAHGHRGPHALPRVVAQVVLHVILEPDG